MIAKRRLKSGDKLPSVRKLATELVVNPNTIANAYKNLERKGLVVTKTGSGTYVSDIKQRGGDRAEINLLTEQMDSIIVESLNVGVAKEELVDVFAKRIAKFKLR